MNGLMYSTCINGSFNLAVNTPHHKLFFSEVIIFNQSSFGTVLKALSKSQNCVAGRTMARPVISTRKEAFSKRFCLKNHLLRVYYFEIDCSAWLVLIELNCHYDGNGLAGQFWQMESALRHLLLWYREIKIVHYRAALLSFSISLLFMVSCCLHSAACLCVWLTFIYPLINAKLHLPYIFRTYLAVI